MNYLRILVCGLALGFGAVPATANWFYTPGGGPSAFRSFNSGTTPAGTSACAAANVDCTATVPIDLTGSPLFITGNPGLVTGTGGTFPVTGTFWQTTQPVSGTFWQATQPVSGTFWQATQPISGTVTANQGTSPWVIGGPAAAGAAPVGNPIFTGMFDGTDIRRVMGDETNGLWVNIKAGAGSGGTALADEAAFTQGTTNTTPLGCFYTTSVTNLTTGQAGVARCTNDRQQMVADAAVLAQLVMLNATALTPVPFPINLTGTSCAGTATGTAANALTSSATRHGGWISNISSDVLWISWTGTATVGGANNSTPLPPMGSSGAVSGGSFTYPAGAGLNNALSIVSAGTSSPYTCTQY